ncbi:MFS transporter [Shouchella patagoniensis]|uniref:MFS transporter n=1 Tax=Shouchella patagoniensis TaxID=228576 RepID=UPI00099500A8|nr:MFS transporter [Shouchella patagoniensis]
MNVRLLILVFGTFIIGTDDFVIAGLLPEIAAEMNVSIAATGQLVTAFALAYAIGAPIWGTIAYRFDIKKLLVFSMLLFTVSNALSAVVSSFEWLFVTRITAAISAALFTPLAMAASTQLSKPSSNGKALSFITAGLTIGLILGAPVGTWIGTTFHWRYSFAFVATISLLVACAILLFMPNLKGEVASSIKERLSSFTKSIALTLCVSIIATTGGFMTYTYIAPLITSATGIQSISLFLLLIGIGAFAGNLLGGIFTDLVGARKTLAFSLLAFCVLLSSFSFITLISNPSTSTILTIIVALLWGIPGFGMNPAINSFLISLNPKQAAMVLSFSASALYTGIGLGALLGGAVISLTSISFLGIASGGVLLIAFVLFRYVANKG